MKENPVSVYISAITAEFKSGQATEHAYRPALKALFESLVPKLQAINDPKHSEHGAPDFALMRSRELSAGYAEAKDLKVSLDETEKGEQMERYLEYGSLILTNSLEFRFYRHGNKYGEPIVVAKIIGNEIVPNEKAYSDLEDAIRTFLTQTERISSSANLAKIMGDKARRIRDKVSEYVTNEHVRNEELRRMYESFKKILIHDLTGEQFADMYAQTLVYGLFAARYEDKTQADFTRQEARDLVPHSNPFLRSFFDHIVGATFDIRLAVIVNELCEVFKFCDVHALMNSYVTQKGLHAADDKETADPVIHFYEDFLKEYDAEKRKSLGAFYTPLPVVRFIIRSVDHILKTEFNLTGGLSDTTKIEVKTTKQGKTARESVHKVQVLDPATGTGTFLNETVKYIATGFKGQEGRWKSYVENDLLPRLHGFELMMAPYTIAHLKIAMTLHDSGITDFGHRLGLYLTNSLEEGLKIEDSLFGLGFGQSITDESKAAAKIKNDTPIMVVMGNPPYSGESSNAHYSGNDVYKVEPTGGKLRERNSKWLNDDYVKFIRLAESMIEKTGEGIVSMITAHGYIDNPTFRGMRWHLMQTFDEIYIVDLHGNANKKEKSPDGTDDKNVFDIKSGVAIFIGLKRDKKSKNNLAKIFRLDCFGTRQGKFEYLNRNLFQDIKWEHISPSGPNYEWVARDTKANSEYQKGFSVADLFPISSVGIVTSRDDFVIDYDKDVLRKRINDFLACSTPQEALTKFRLKENLKWKAINALKHTFEENSIVPISYRPFDNRFVYYNNDFIERSRAEVMRHIINGNICLNVLRQVKAGDSYQHVLASKNITESTLISNKTSEIDYVLPLFVYSNDGSKVPNLKKEIVAEIERIVGKVSPEDIFDYIYVSLHSPTYREKYKEFLKIDFPRVQYPKDEKSFKALVVLGRELRELHLMESPKLKDLITTFSVSGNDTVEAKYPKYKDGKVFINETQYFGGVPEVAWNFYIGGYQPAQKWLKDRKERKLTNEDFEYYQRIIVVLVETGRIMGKIDLLNIV